MLACMPVDQWVCLCVCVDVALSIDWRLTGDWHTSCFSSSDIRLPFTEHTARLDSTRRHRVHFTKIGYDHFMWCDATAIEWQSNGGKWSERSAAIGVAGVAYNWHFHIMQSTGKPHNCCRSIHLHVLRTRTRPTHILMHRCARSHYKFIFQWGRERKCISHWPRDKEPNTRFFSSLSYFCACFCVCGCRLWSQLDSTRPHYVTRYVVVRTANAYTFSNASNGHWPYILVLVVPYLPYLPTCWRCVRCVCVCAWVWVYIIMGRVQIRMDAINTN